MGQGNGAGEGGDAPSTKRPSSATTGSTGGAGTAPSGTGPSASTSSGRPARASPRSPGSPSDGQPHGQPPPEAKLIIALNVYDLQDKNKNNTFGTLGFGIYHSAVELNCRVEWSFGGNPQAPKGVTGVFPCHPRAALPAEAFNQRIELGRSIKTDEEVSAIIRDLSGEWSMRSYHLLKRNCNHFSTQLVERLRRGEETYIKAVPSWVNRAARVADAVCPDRIYHSLSRTVPQPPTGDGTGGVKSGGNTFTASGASSHRPTSTASQPKQERRQQGAGGQSGSSYPEPLSNEPIPPMAELRSMGARDLKSIMFIYRISWEGCVEKQDMLDAIAASNVYKQQQQQQK